MLHVAEKEPAVAELPVQMTGAKDTEDSKTLN
jgi:hypothetical protein